METLSHALGRSEFGKPENVGNILSDSDALALLNEWVLNEKLRVHMHQVAHLMRAWAAEREGLDEAGQRKWWQAGLLHDADWDQWPDEHCRRIIEELERRDVDPELIHAIASHGPGYFGVEPVTNIDKMLFAFDELSGFLHAYSLMRPNGYEGMEVKGVLKRMKDKAFAANVSRDDMRDAAARAGLPFEEIIRFAIGHQAGAVTAS